MWGRVWRKVLGGDGYIHYLECSNDFTGVKYAKTSQMVHVKYVQLIGGESCLIKLLRKVIITVFFQITTYLAIVDFKLNQSPREKAIMRGI